MALLLGIALTISTLFLTLFLCKAYEDLTNQQYNFHGKDDDEKGI